MISVAEAEHIILSHTGNYGTELIPFELAMGRLLAQDITADRDLPPCNRVTMDGIAIRSADFERGNRTYRIIATIAAGDQPKDITTNECVEIMTGAALPDTADTVVRYEDLAIEKGVATITTDAIKLGQNIHRKGKDKQQGEVVAAAGQVIDAAVISMAVSVGKTMLTVSKLPRIVIISTGDELVDIDTAPTAYQVRRSNSYTMQATLQRYCINADTLHLPDEPHATKEKLKECLAQYDAVLLSGGVSMGRFDYVPQALEELQVTKLFHKVRQRPGKPFWFGRHGDGTVVFAFPGNPVSTFMCLHRYFLPWLRATLQTNNTEYKSPLLYAVLDTDIAFAPALQYYVQVRLHMNEQGQLLATPMEGNGSGDFANLLDTDAFMELPEEQHTFNKGQAYRIWPFKQFI